MAPRCYVQAVQGARRPWGSWPYCPCGWSRGGWLDRGHEALRLGAALGLVAALTLQGCDAAVHEVGNWRRETDYLVDFQYVPPGRSTFQLGTSNH